MRNALKETNIKQSGKNQSYSKISNYQWVNVSNACKKSCLHSYQTKLHWYQIACYAWSENMSSSHKNNCTIQLEVWSQWEKGRIFISVHPSELSFMLVRLGACVNLYTFYAGISIVTFNVHVYWFSCVVHQGLVLRRLL